MIPGSIAQKELEFKDRRKYLSVKPFPVNGTANDVINCITISLSGQTGKNIIEYHGCFLYNSRD